MGSPELDLGAWKKKQNEPRSSAEIVLCMYLPIENIGIPSKNSAGSKTRGKKLLQALMIISCFKNICLFIWLRQVLVAACGISFPDQGSNLDSLPWESWPLDHQGSPLGDF